ncbi:MAG: THUMP domain-containing protein, partial [Nanoarchaeota archaeon]
MDDVVVLRYTEITLKGKNRGFFENLLLKNIRKTLQNHNVLFSYLKKTKGRILVGFECKKESERALCVLSSVFGVQSLSKGLLVEAEMENIKKASLEILDKSKFQTFRISTKRGDKSFSKTSNDVDREMGAFVVENFSKNVDLKNYQLEIKIEIFNGLALVSVETIPGAGGLPVGCGGKVFVGTGYANHLAAAYYMMKRGCVVVFYGRKNPDEKSLKYYNSGFPLGFIEAKEDLLGTMEENA